MLSNAASLLLCAPEVVLSVGIVIVLGLGMVGPRAARVRVSRNLVIALTLTTLVAAAASTIATAVVLPRALFGGLLVRDSFADFFKLLFAAAGAIVALASVRARDLLDDVDGDRDAPELAAILLAVVLGASLMAAAQDLLLAYLSLEFVSILSYVLTGFTRRSRRSAEAALKYAIYGGVATASMLYGFSLLFGLAASTDLGAVRTAAAAAPSLTVAVAVTLCLAGFSFKMAVVPFHMWCPDVYEGAPTPVSAFFSIVPKAAGFALAYRFLVGPTGATWPAESPAAPTSNGPAATWAIVICVLAAVTMGIGNFAALGQRNIKRLLAYSSIAHAGTILMALGVGTEPALEALLIYLGVYLFMNLAAFLVVIAVAEQGVGETLGDFAGLGSRSPLAAFCLTVSLFSLAGLPPTGGFVAKYALFAAVVHRGMDGGGAPFFALALWGVVNTVVSLYYYARLVRVMYLGPVVHGQAVVRLAPLHVALLSATTAPVLLLGIYVTPLSDLAGRSLGLWSGH